MIKSLKDYYNRKRKTKIIIIVSQIVLLSILIISWELLTRLNILNEFLLSKPSSIYSLFIQYLKSGELHHHVYISTIETIIALIISTIGGLIIGTLLYMSNYVHKILDPYLTVLNAIPKTALGPIIIIWLGTGIKGIIGVSICFSIIITIISSLTYFNSVDKDLIKMMKIMGGNKLQILFKIVYPSNVDNLLSLLKVNIGLSWVGVIVGEYLVSREGVGYLVLYGGQVFKMDLVMLGLIILSVITLIMYEIVNLIQAIIRYKRKLKKK